MANPGKTAPKGTEKTPASEANGPRLGTLSVDFLVVALPFSLFIDLLDFVFEIGTLVSLVLGVPLILWMVWREKNVGAAKEAIEQAKQYRQRRQGAKVGAKRIARRRILRRALLIYVAEAIPIVNLVPFWLIGTVRTAQRT